MSFGNSTEDDILKLIYNATAMANVADNTATSPLANIALALHTASPADTGTQTTNEAAYTGYSRGSTVRTSGATGWTVASGVATLGQTQSFGACTALTATITHGSTGKTGGGATQIFNYGAISPNISVSAGVTPQWTTSSTITLD